jgi:DNA-binding PadR family transcriptional regulator
MKDISNIEAALMGLLSEQPMHPYQIEQQVKFRDMRFWADLSMSSIYKLLRKLEKEALVNHKNVISPENRLQKLYSLTGQGMEMLKQKIQLLISQPEHMRWQFDIGVYNCNLIKKEKVKESLLNYQKILEEKIKGYKDLLEFLKKERCPNYRFALATRPVAIFESEIKWINSFLKDMEKPVKNSQISKKGR